MPADPMKQARFVHHIYHSCMIYFLQLCIYVWYFYRRYQNKNLMLKFLSGLILPEPPCPDEQNLCNGECIPDKDKDCIPDERVIFLMILHQPVIV